MRHPIPTICASALAGAAFLAPAAAHADDATRCTVTHVCADGACGIETEFTTLFLSDRDGRLVVEFDAAGEPLLLHPLGNAPAGITLHGAGFGAETMVMMHEPATGRLALLMLPPADAAHSGLISADCERN